MVVWVRLEEIGWHQVILVTTYCTNGKDIVPRRKDEGEYRSCSGTSAGEHECKNGEQDGQECCYHGSELGTLPERCGHKERPAGKRETK